MAERGRPTRYDKAIADEICRRLADGASLREICRDDHMPAESTVRLWHVENREGFSAQYTRAREAQAHFFADEILEISDDGSNDWILRQGKDGETFWQLNGENIQRSRLRTDTRKWLLSKVLPKVYGEKIIAEHTGADGGPIQHEDVGARDALLSRIGGVASRVGTNGGAPKPH